MSRELTVITSHMLRRGNKFPEDLATKLLLTLIATKYSTMTTRAFSSSTMHNEINCPTAADSTLIVITYGTVKLLKSLLTFIEHLE